MDLTLVLTILGLIFGFVALPLAFYFGRRSRQKPDLRFCHDFDVLLNRGSDLASDPIRISYGDAEIPRVSRTLIAIWNQRGDTVRSEDVVGADPLRVVFEDDTALQVALVACSREQCAPAVAINSEDGSRVDLAFDFLDEGDGFVVEIVHQGTIAGTVRGTVRGATLSNRGRAALDREALVTVGEPSWWKRVRNGIGVRRLITLVAPVVAMFGVLALMLILEQPFRQPSLVGAGAYDLTSVDGQREFAEQVRDRGELGVSQRNLMLLMFLPPMALALLVVARIGMFRRVIPESVVAVRYFPDPDADPGDNAMSNEA